MSQMSLPPKNIIKKTLQKKTRINPGTTQSGTQGSKNTLL